MRPDVLELLDGRVLGRGGWLKKEGMCVYLGVICIAVQKKPTQLVKPFPPNKK